MSITLAVTAEKAKAPTKNYARVYWPFVVPAGVVVAAVIVLPWVFTLVMSVHEWKIGSDPTFVGFENYIRLFGDERFQWALLRTLYFTALAVIFPMLLGVAAAVTFHKNFPFRGIARTAFILPMMATPVAVALVWTMMFHPQLGVLNFLLTSAGLPPSQWSYSASTVIPTLTAFAYYNMGYASAVTVVFFILIMLISLPAMNASRIAGRIGFGAAVFALISPAILVFLWMLSLALKNEVDNMAFPPVFVPNPPTMANFVDVFEKNDFVGYAWNSIVVSFSATGLALLLGVPAGFGIAKSKASRAAALIMIARVTPGLSYLIPLWGPLAAAALLVTAPVLLLTLLMQKEIGGDTALHLTQDRNPTPISI
eukprot:gene5220-5272_t